MEKIIKDNKRLFNKENIPEEYLFSYYMQDIKRPLYVALPINEEEIIEIVKYANLNDKKIIARGASTGAVGSQMPVLGDEIIVDIRLMSGITNFDEETLTLTVLPGTTLGMVQEYAAKLGLLYAPDPASKDSTIAGNVSTNAGGMRALKYGTTKDHVKAIRVVLADGNVTELGELTVKNSAGYDLKNLFIGSEGTLGIITEVKLGLVPKPALTKSLVISFETIEQATDTVLEILKSKFNVSAIELFDRVTISYSEQFMKQDFPSKLGNAHILMSLDSEDETQLNMEINRLKTCLNDRVLDFVELDEKTEELAWHLRDNILYALMQFTKYEMLDEVVPLNKFAEMVTFTKTLEKKHNVTILNFGHAGDGNIHTILLQENYTDEQWVTIKEALLIDIYDKVKELGGLISAEHGIGHTKRKHFLMYTDKVKVELMRSVKKAIDPKNIFNPNKIF